MNLFKGWEHRHGTESGESLTLEKPVASSLPCQEKQHYPSSMDELHRSNGVQHPNKAPKVAEGQLPRTDSKTNVPRVLGRDYPHKDLHNDPLRPFNELGWSRLLTNGMDGSKNRLQNSPVATGLLESQKERLASIALNSSSNGTQPPTAVTLVRSDQNENLENMEKSKGNDPSSATPNSTIQDDISASKPSEMMSSSTNSTSIEAPATGTATSSASNGSSLPTSKAAQASSSASTNHVVSNIPPMTTKIAVSTPSPGPERSNVDTLSTTGPPRVTHTTAPINSVTTSTTHMAPNKESASTTTTLAPLSVPSSTSTATASIIASPTNLQDTNTPTNSTSIFQNTATLPQATPTVDPTSLSVSVSPAETLSESTSTHTSIQSHSLGLESATSAASILAPSPLPNANTVSSRPVDGAISTATNLPNSLLYTINSTKATSSPSTPGTPSALPKPPSKPRIILRSSGSSPITSPNTSTVSSPPVPPLNNQNGSPSPLISPITPPSNALPSSSATPLSLVSTPTSSASSPMLRSLDAYVASLPSKYSETSPMDFANIRLCVSALRRLSLTLYSCPYARNEAWAPYVQCLDVAGIPSAIFTLFSKAFATLYPLVKLSSTEISSANMLVVDPLRDFDWSQYLVILHGGVVVKRSWVEETIRLNSPPVIDPFLIALTPDPLNGSSPYFSPTLLQGHALILLDFDLSSLSLLCRTKTETPTDATFKLDLALRHQISIALQFLGLSFGIWSSSQENCPHPPESAILIADAKSTPESSAQPKNPDAMIFAQIWTPHQLLNFLSRPSSIPSLPKAPIDLTSPILSQHE